ncbi:MAG TPA: VCBS repeat-containing protein [Polyangia bacterium]
MNYAQAMTTRAPLGSTMAAGGRRFRRGGGGFAVFVVLSLAPLTGLAAPAAHGKVAAARPPGADKKPARKAAPVRFSCADSLDDGTLVDATQAPSLTKLARLLPWPEIGAPPALPPRDLRMFCGPDVDGDGDRDFIVRASFDNPENGASELDADLLTYTFLASKRAGSWRALGPLTADLTGDRDVEQSVAFVRRPSGQWAVEVERSSFASETGCRITGYEVFAWRGSALATVEAGDRSPVCAPCGCDHP